MDQKLLNALMSNIFPAEEMTSYFKALIYGEPGAGKTTLASQIGKKILFIAADPSGWESLKNHPELGFFENRFMFVQYKGLATLDAVYQAIFEGQKGFTEYDTLLIDTANHIGSLDLDRVTSIRINKKGGVAETAAEVKNKFDFERDMYGVYNENTFRIRSAFLKLYTLPMNVIATAHAKPREIEDVKVTMPNLTPEVFASVNGLTSMIAYMTATPKVDKAGNKTTYERVIQVHPSATIRAKSRIGGLPLLIKNPNLRVIVDKWQESGGKLRSPAEAEKPIVTEETASDLETFGLD